MQAAARRFVFDYQCKNYYIQCDEKDKKNHEKSNNTQKCEEDPGCVCDNDKCKLPSPSPEPIDRDYNDAENDLKKLRNTVDAEPKKNDDDDLFVKTKKSGRKRITVVANKYSHKGDLIDFYGPTSKRKTGKDISFADFMKQNKEQ